MTTYDSAAGKRGKDDGQERVCRPALDEWKAHAIACIRRIAETFELFTIDDVSPLIGPVEEGVDPRILGPMLLDAAKLRLCAQTEDFMPSYRASCHHTPRRIWRSLLWETPIANARSPSEPPGA